jgi:hypothetical protein
MSKYLGNYLSPVNNPLIKSKRLIQIARELYELLSDLEDADAVKQENFARQLEISERKLLATHKTLDGELSLNNELVKEGHVKDKRIDIQEKIISEQKEKLEQLKEENNKLKQFKRKTRHKFKRWLEKRLEIKKKHKIKLEKLK